MGKENCLKCFDIKHAKTVYLCHYSTALKFLLFYFTLTVGVGGRTTTNNWIYKAGMDSKLKLIRKKL